MTNNCYFIVNIRVGNVFVHILKLLVPFSMKLIIIIDNNRNGFYELKSCYNRRVMLECEQLKTFFSSLEKTNRWKF